MTFQYCFDGSIKKVNNLSVSSPRTWGCFQVPSTASRKPTVFPTHVGVFLCQRPLSWQVYRLPHARGGVSHAKHGMCSTGASSPRTWGCFSLRRPHVRQARVFPTHVGVFLAFILATNSGRCLPHARGGVSDFFMLSIHCSTSSPRTWGCFFSFTARSLCRNVFPTHVGVFPPRRLWSLTVFGLPHARGGVSELGLNADGMDKSSPRTWGCFEP